MFLLIGNAVWREAAAAKTSPDRSWQSLKNRFWTNIVPNIHKYKLISENHRNLIIRICNKRSSRTDDNESADSVSCSNPYLNFLREEEGKQQQSRPRKRTDSRESPESDELSSSELSTLLSANRRSKYTAEEDKAIVAYVRKRMGWSKRTGKQIHLRGQQFWSEMRKWTKHERTGQSLRERFMKRILPNLNDLMPDEPEVCDAIRKVAAFAESQ